VTGASLADLTAGTRQTIGRYFSVVSMVPSLLLVVYIFLLIHSGAWRRSPEWGVAVNALVHVGVGGAAVLIVLGMALGLGIHPAQFGLLQFLEGYWGVSTLARIARNKRVTHHRKRVIKLEAKDTEGDHEAGRLLTQYPTELDHVMPTRLGNVLRRYELLAGRQYSLNALAVLPHMALVAESEDVRYLDDQRAQLDLAVRMCLMAVIASGATVALLCRDGPWIFTAVIPTGFAYISYRGAVVSAREYGAAIITLIDLNRFAFYDRLHLPLPNNIVEERKNNSQLMKLLEANSTHVFMRYKHPAGTNKHSSDSK
jgi:hypothetical protein